jgi:hypothetical protein
MTIEVLEGIEQRIFEGTPVYACCGPNINDWIVEESLESIRARARKAAAAKRAVVTIYRVVGPQEVSDGDSFLVVRKLIEGRPGGPPSIQWTLVDTAEAAELLRDVSKGPTPYFGAVAFEVIQPS